MSTSRRDQSPTGEPKGTPDPAAQKAVAEANRAPDDAQTVKDGQTATPSPAIAPDEEAQLVAMLEEKPALVSKLRSILGVPDGGGQVAPEHGWRDYNAPELRVFGGTEVRHPEWENGKGSPLPPSSIKRYLRADGTKTDYAEPLVERRRKQVPVIADNGKPAVNADGNQIFEEEPVDVVVDQGAAHDGKGRPIKTPEYRAWLTARRTGGRLGSDVRSQIRAGTYGDNDVPTTDPDGAPLTQGAAVPMPAGAEE